VAPAMKALVTGGAGFIGRWVVERLLRQGHDTLVLDDYSNGRAENLKELEKHPKFLGAMRGDIKDTDCLESVFEKGPWDVVFHLAASIHVQKSIDDPEPTFRNDAEGTLRVLEAARAQYFRLNGLDPSARKFDFDRDVRKCTDKRPRVACMSTCMVYDLAGGEPITERHAYRPASPYAASKIGSDMLALSYHHAYKMPVVVVRPFNTYGPFQKSNSEGGVVSIFLKQDLAKEPLFVKGTGEQTRDLLYVEDCADFVTAAAFSERAEGQILNAGTGTDIPIRELAKLCCTAGNRIEHVPHDHPQAEIARLLADASRAKDVLGWSAKTSLTEGLARTRRWLADNRWGW
jgi:nucleoside-diphosphate-sugar epimerase